MSSRSQSNMPGVEGSDYEVNLLTLFSLKALFSNKIANFQIESNNAKYGKFDDIILTLTPVEGKEIKVAFQLKHKVNVKILKGEQLNHLKGDFSIHKYFESYEDEIKIEDKQNCHYVLFTNNQIDLNSFNPQSSKLSIVQDTSNILFNSLLNICDSHKIHRFRNTNDVSQDEFFERFYLFSDQNNEKEVEDEIEEIFTQNFGSNETAKLSKLFKNLHKGRFTNKKLDKRTLICHLIDLIIFPHHCINLEQVHAGQESLCEYFYNAVKLFDATHIDCENLEFLKQNLRHINHVSEKNAFLWAKDHKFVDREMRDTAFRIDSHCRIFYHIDNQPIILNYSRDSAKAINCVIKLCNEKFPQIKFILAGSENDFDLYKKDPELNCLNLFENLRSLKMKDNTTYQQLINQFEVEVNGRKLTSLTEFVSFNDQIANNITPNIILNSLKTGVIKFGDESNAELPLNYIPRQIAGDLLRFKNLPEDKSTLFIISCGRQLDKIQDFLKTRYLNSLDFDKNENNTDINTNIILTASKNDITEKELNKKIRHDFRKICYLEAIIENDSFLGNFRYRKHKKEDLTKIIVEENEIQKYFQRSIEVVSATPGMGKTSLMKSISKNYPPNYFCILIPLIDYSDFFKEKHSIVDLLKQYFSKKNVSVKFQAHLTSYILQKCKVTFMFDGFDEIDQKSHDNLFKCVEEVRKTRHKVWISTRPNFSELLRDRFNVNVLEIVELNVETQEEYIKNRLSESKKVSEIDEIITNIYENIVIERHQTLLGTPLLLHMITEMVINNEEDLLNVNNITDLFKYFFKGKLIHHINKHGLSTFVKEYFNAKLDSYTIPALKLCLEADLFNKLNLYTNTEQVESIRKSGDGLGVIVNVSGDRDDPNFSFFHNTYAEYFAAKWLAANYTRIPIENRSFLLEDKYENLKFMFDILMAEGCPAHIAVLCGDETRLAECTEDEIVMTDKLNRSVWHIICASGDKFPSTGISYYERGNKIVKNIRKIIPKNLYKQVYKIDKYICKFQPNNPHENLHEHLEKAKIPFLERDILFNKTALDYAIERFSINIFDHIFKIFKTADIDFNKLLCLSDNKYLIIYYSLKFGYLNLLQLNFIRNVLKTQKLAYIEYIDNSDLEKRVNVAYIAAKYGQLEVLRYLYTLANSYYTFDDPPLWVAAEKGHLDIVKELIAHNADVNATHEYGWTPLWWAAEKGHLDIVKELIAQNADVNATHKYGWTPLWWAAKKGHLDIVKELIAQNADVNAKHKYGWTPLRVAAEKGHLDVVKELIAHNADVNATHKYVWTPLLMAVRLGYLDIVEELKAQNADVNAAFEDGGTPLRVAAELGYLDIVKELIAQNADVNATHKHGWTPLLWAAEKGHLDIVKELIAQNADVNATHRYGRTPLLWAAEKGHLDIVKELIAHNADVNATDTSGWTSLRWAAEIGHLDIVKELIAQNADVNATDTYGWTSLRWAAEKGHLNIVKELIAHNADVNATHKYEWPALWCAAKKGHLDIVKELIAHNADVNETDYFGWNPLYWAVEKGHLDIVKELIAQNADVNAKHKYRWTPLRVAAEKGHLDIVKELIAQNADVNATHKYGWTPLWWAAKKGHLDIVKELIAQNADVNATNKDGWTVLGAAAENGHLDVVKELIAHNANVNAIHKYGWTPLFYAADKSQLEIVKELIAHNADVNATDKDEWTPLRWAAQQGHVNIVKELITHNADVNAADTYGWTPLRAAAYQGHLDIVKELIAHNADVNAIHKYGWTPLWWAAEKGHLDMVKELIARNVNVNAAYEDGGTPLRVAAEKGDLDIVKELIAHNADVNATDKDGCTPLWWAAEKGHLNIVKELIAHNADINASDNGGWSPFHWAAYQGHLDIVKELIEHKADINATDEDGRTPFYLAAYQGHLDIIKELIAHNAHINATYTYGETPLFWAAHQGHLDIVKELIEHKADVNATLKYGWTSLWWAAERGHLNIVKELIAHNADVNAADKDGLTALMVAAENGHLDVVKELIAHNANVNATDEDGRTPLWWAKKEGHLIIVKELERHSQNT